MKILYAAPLPFGSSTFRAKIGLIFEPRDLWVGCFWDLTKFHNRPHLVIYLAAVPTLVLRLYLPLTLPGEKP